MQAAVIFSAPSTPDITQAVGPFDSATEAAEWFREVLPKLNIGKWWVQQLGDPEAIKKEVLG